MQLAHKVKLKPNNNQITYFKKACGVARFAWNWGLNRWNELYASGDKPSGFSLKKEFNSIKKEQFPFVYEVTKYACQQPFIELQNAWNRYFKKLSGVPKFKKKGKSKDSFYIGGDQIVVKDNKVKVPNLGYVRMHEKIRFDGKILNAVISRHADDWYIAFTIETTLSPKLCENQASIGLDVGSKNFVMISNGVAIEAPKPLRKLLRRYKRMCRKLSRKQHRRTKTDTTPKSKNYLKYQRKVAKLHQRISNVRKDFLHKLTTFITSNFKYIAIEDLNIKGMLANGKIALTVSDLGLYEFRRQLEYKSKMRDNVLTIADRWFPSSKTCSLCGNVKKELKLSERVYICEACGNKLDRDLNASINLNKLNPVPPVRRELTAAETTALLCHQGIATSVIETASEQQTYMIRFA